ncbi:arsenic resistance protein [Microbacterium sp. SA39]|uniref:arsenic resistance protein n=1 Tax=Microbacterium sp. SA39 TaxID=1263625 RepID=UPI00061E9166|nr:symporter [Microbacterium sp. SA39]KJQ54845.1 Sodium Bile acid symporter family protein [Microbacterium sp. SA39]
MLTAALRSSAVAGLFLVAIATGSLLGAFAPAAATRVSAFADPLILVLVGALFFTLRLDGLSSLRRAPRTMLLALGMNFLIVPLVALVLTALLPGEALRLGVLIYCLAPCTDWFLGFTRLAGGDTTTGAALIPVQLVLQLLLYPVWLGLFAGEHVDTVLTTAAPTLLTWFVLPAAIGLGARLVLHLTIAAIARSRIAAGVDRAIPAIIAAVIAAIFAGNVGTILADPASFAWVLVVVFLFFVVIYALGEGVRILFRLRPAEHALLTMTTSARNAPLMLAVTTIALPDEPLVHAAIVLGMLIEFPHLSILTLLLRRRRSQGAAEAVAESQLSR